MRKLLFFLLCVVISSCEPAYALQIGETPITEFLATPPVLITAYQMADSAQRLVAVEVYNSGDMPLDMAEWQLYINLKDGASQQVVTSTACEGMLLPGEHLVYSEASSTTYKFIFGKQSSSITSLELRPGSSSAIKKYKPAIALIKDQTDQTFFRTYTSTGYSTATQPFLATPARTFYDDGLYKAYHDLNGLEIVEFYPYSSECSPFDDSVLCGDYIKLANAGAVDVDLDGLVLRTDSGSASRMASNTFTLAGKLKAGDYLAVTKTDSGARISLTNSGGYAWIEDAWGLARYEGTMAKYEPAGTGEQGYAYSLTSDGAWSWTITPEPMGKNTISKPVVAVAECPEGKYRNPETGRCRTIEETMNALSVCDEGYERNPTTNRCRKIAVATTAALTPCLEGQERNPATNRCRSIASAVAELMPCDEGYERNPATNRCRKVTSASVPSAGFPVTPVAAAASDKAGWWAFGAVLVLAAGYGVWEWRAEIVGTGRRVLGILRRTR